MEILAAEERAWWDIEPFGSNDPWTLKWDIVIILFAVFNAIFIPFTINNIKLSRKGFK